MLCNIYFFFFFGNVAVDQIRLETTAVIQTINRIEIFLNINHLIISKF